MARGITRVDCFERPAQRCSFIAHRRGHLSSLTGGCSTTTHPVPHVQSLSSRQNKSWVHYCTAKDHKTRLWVWLPLRSVEGTLENISSHSSRNHLLFSPIPGYSSKPLLKSATLPSQCPPVTLWLAAEASSQHKHQLSSLRVAPGSPLSLPSLSNPSKTDFICCLLPPSLSFSLPPSPFNSSPPTGTDSCGANTPSSISVPPLSLSVWEQMPLFPDSVLCLSGLGMLLCLFLPSLPFILCQSITAPAPTPFM